MGQVGFTRVTGKDHLLTLAHTIKDDLPLSATMYNNLLVHSRGHSSSRATFYVLTNNPDSHAVMWLLKEQYTQAAFLCREQEVDQLTKALKETSLIDWSELLLFRPVSECLVGPLQEVTEDLRGTSLATWPRFSFTYHPHLDHGPLRCGAGLRVCRLGKAGLQRLLQTNTFSKNDPLEPMWRYVQRVPAVGVYLDPSVTHDTPVDLDNLPRAGDEDLPVSWLTMTMFGTLGRLGTAEGYRRRGLGTLLMRVGARLKANQGYIPCANVEPSNSASLAMFRRMPEWSHTHNLARMTSAS